MHVFGHHYTFDIIFKRGLHEFLANAKFLIIWYLVTSTLRWVSRCLVRSCLFKLKFILLRPLQPSQSYSVFQEYFVAHLFINQTDRILTLEFIEVLVNRSVLNFTNECMFLDSIIHWTSFSNVAYTNSLQMQSF